MSNQIDKCWPPRTKFSTHPCVRNKNIRQSTAPTGCSKSAQIGCSQFLRSTAVSAGPVSIQRNDPPCLPPVRRMYRSTSRPVPLGRAFLRHSHRRLEQLAREIFQPPSNFACPLRFKGNQLKAETGSGSNPSPSKCKILHFS